MKIHPRTMLADKIGCDIRTAFWNAVPPDALTYLELLRVINDLEASVLKMALREERHPDNPDAPADVE